MKVDASENCRSRVDNAAFSKSAIFFIYHCNYTRRIDFRHVPFYPSVQRACPWVSCYMCKKGGKRKTNSGNSRNRAQTTHEQSHPDATACSCILNRQLLLSRATDDPFNLKEWKVSRQQVKGESSRRVERNWEEGRSERRTEGAIRQSRRGDFPKLFPSNWLRAIHASPPSFFNLCNKIAGGIKDAEVDRSYSENRRLG